MAHGRVERMAVMLRAGGVFSAGLALLVIAGCVVVGAVLASDGQLDGDAGGTPTFSTTAAGTVEVPASSATTTVHLLGCGDGPGLALQQANGRLAGMTKAWRGLDVPKDAIARGSVSTYRSGKQWCTNLTAVATVDDLELVDEVLTGIAKYPRGIQSIDGPTYDYDTARLEEGALDEAMRVARRKADDAAKRAGTRVVGVGSIAEGPIEVTRPDQQNPVGGYMSSSGQAAMAVSAKVESYTTAVSRNSGKATATVSVEAEFRLEA